MSNLRERLFISTTADDAHALAEEYGLGLEIADFCTAYNMDLLFAEYDQKAREKMQGIRRFIFHAAYNELCPAAIDPLIREHTARRFHQAIDLSLRYGIKKIVIHSGFIPQIYFPQWFIPESVKFWQSFMSEVPDDVSICLENVMEQDPQMLPEIIRQTDDPRLRLCLDIGHAFSRSEPRPLSEWIDAAVPYLSHVHIHDNDGSADMHRTLGEGSIDLPFVLDRIISGAPEATFTVENMHAAGSVFWLRKNQFI